jgi:DNA-binding transcriptional MerR regulator
MTNNTLLTVSSDRNKLHGSYQEFAQDNQYKQKSYLNFLNFLKTKKQNYYGFSAGEIGDMFEEISTASAVADTKQSAQEDIFRRLQELDEKALRKKEKIHTLIQEKSNITIQLT